MSEKEWIESIIEDKNHLLFFKGTGNLIYKNQCGVNRKTPTEMARQDLDQALILVLNTYKYAWDETFRNSFFGIFHSKLLVDIKNLTGFIPRIDYAHPMNALDNEMGCVGNIRLICFDDDRLICDKDRYKFILVETKNFLCKTEEFIVPEVINRLIIESTLFY